MASGGDCTDCKALRKGLSLGGAHAEANVCTPVHFQLKVVMKETIKKTRTTDQDAKMDTSGAPGQRAKPHVSDARWLNGV